MHNTVDVVQLVRASVCGSECRGFESPLPPRESLVSSYLQDFFAFMHLWAFLKPSSLIIDVNALSLSL